MKPIRVSAVVLSALAVVACKEFPAPRYVSHLGYIDATDEPVIVPDTVSKSTNFTVSFYTTGGGCEIEGNTMVTIVDSATAEVRAYDQLDVNHTVCPAILKFFPHSATLQFAQEGKATVRLVGALNDSTITIARTVVVR